MSKGISDAQVAKETLFAPEPEPSDEEGCVVTSMKHENGEIQITISVSPEEAKMYSVGQKLSITPMDSEAEEASDE